MTISEYLQSVPQDEPSEWRQEVEEQDQQDEGLELNNRVSVVPDNDSQIASPLNEPDKQVIFDDDGIPLDGE